MKPLSAHKITLPEALGNYAQLSAARFHMPGHKGFPIMGSASGELAAWDVTEIDGTDDLAAPDGCILELEERMANVYGARHAFLLVNGSSCGVVSMLLSLGEGKRVLLARDCHKSAISGMALAGHEAAYVCPRYDSARGLCGVVSAEDVDAALQESPCDAVFITSPNYYGACVDVSAIAKVCRAHGALLLVDCAHGAHFPFLESLRPYLPSEADMYCVSAHKTLSALTQSAVLFASNSCPLDDEHIRRAITLVQTSSPSYLLMTSMDWALYSAKTRPWDRHEARIIAVRERFSSINGVRLLGESDAGAAGIAAVDMTRLTFLVNERGISGTDAMPHLAKHGVTPEMADASHIVCITSPNDPDEWYSRLYDAISTLPYGTRSIPFSPHTPAKKPPVMSIRSATLADFEAVPYESAAGRVAARATGAYPPGIATLFPGERIEVADILKLRAYEADGISVFGASSGMIYCVRGKNIL